MTQQAAMTRVVVLGGGIAGLTTALALARRGASVDVLEQDRSPAPFGRRGAAGWLRPGVPQAPHAHVFGPDCPQLLAAELPDVLSLLLAAGAREIPLPGSGPALAMRRPLFDWVLRRAAEREPGVRVHDGTPATGLRFEGSRLTGVRVPGGVLATTVAVDATGADGPVAGWLAGAESRCHSGVGKPHSRAVRQPRPPGDDDPRWPDRATAYVSRCYALRWPGDPGELNLGAAAGGLLDGYSCRAVPGDNQTVTVTFGVPAGDLALGGGAVGAGALAGLREPASFQVAAELVPVIVDWVDPRSADPLTGVRVLDGWPARCRAAGQLPADLSGSPAGLVSVGDATAGRCPAPESGYGVARALAQALACAAALDGDRLAAAQAMAADRTTASRHDPDPRHDPAGGSGQASRHDPAGGPAPDGVPGPLPLLPGPDAGELAEQMARRAVPVLVGGR